MGDIVAFDFDGTLTTTDTTKFLIGALLRARPTRVFAVAPVILRFLCKRIPPQEFKTAAISSLVRGASTTVIERAVGKFVISAQRVLRQDVLVSFMEHVQRGDLVIVATASPVFAVRSVLGARGIEVIGTEFEVKNGLFTGRCLGNCYGEEKARQIRGFLESHGLKTIACAYSDHYSDEPMLALAQRCILVHPDADTKRLLASRDCAVIE